MNRLKIVIRSVFRDSGWARALRDSGSDSGMTTAEYAVGTLAAVAFAGVLLKVLTSPGIQSALSSIVARALK